MLNSQTQQILLNEYVDKESFQSVYPFLVQMKQKGLNPACVTVDGHRYVIHAFKSAWPNLAIQRCLYHIQREGLRWMRTYPKTHAGRELRSLLVTLHQIRSIESRNEFLTAFDQWQSRHAQFVKTLPRTSVAYNDLKRAVRLLKNALPDMFHYLKDPKIRSTTNVLESFYSRLKADFRQHRGLSEKNKANYLNWYCFFKNEQLST